MMWLRFLKNYHEYQSHRTQCISVPSKHSQCFMIVFLLKIHCNSNWMSTLRRFVGNSQRYDVKMIKQLPIDVPDAILLSNVLG